MEPGRIAQPNARLARAKSHRFSSSVAAAVLVATHIFVRSVASLAGSRICGNPGVTRFVPVEEEAKATSVQSVRPASTPRSEIPEAAAASRHPIQELRLFDRLPAQLGQNTLSASLVPCQDTVDKRDSVDDVSLLIGPPSDCEDPTGLCRYSARRLVNYRCEQEGNHLRQYTLVAVKLKSKL